MTVNGLSIDDQIISTFKITYVAHCRKNRAPVCHKARMNFFSALKRQHDGDMQRIIPHLPVLYELLAEWENEVRAELVAA